MSILKDVLSEALASTFSRSNAKLASRAPVAPQDVSRSAGKVSRPASRSGMKVVILNWNRGENDPFSVVNAAMHGHFRSCGKNVEVIEISSDDWPNRLAELAASSGVEFAFTWQGLGSAAATGTTGESIWEFLRIPLICIHGDHPSHAPSNHALESRYCFHLYANADAARYSNRHFRRTRGASVIDIPQVHRERRLEQRSGDYFVVAKNINDPAATEAFWRERADRATLDAYMAAAETLRSRVAKEPYVEMHDVLDDLIAKNNLEWLTPATDIAAYHQYHSQLDHYIRNHKSVTAVTALRDFPLRIYGRGWDRIATNAPALHVFEPGRDMAESQDLYYTRFGLVDVSPSKGLHDRTRRAMVNGSGFLSSANLEDSFPDITPFDGLFFSFGTKDLPEKCTAVLLNPERHHEAAQEFADLYHARFHFRDFVSHIDQLAKCAVQFSASDVEPR
jgi:hypothetical protein